MLLQAVSATVSLIAVHRSPRTIDTGWQGPDRQLQQGQPEFCPRDKGQSNSTSLPLELDFTGGDSCSCQYITYPSSLDLPPPCHHHLDETIRNETRNGAHLLESRHPTRLLPTNILSISTHPPLQPTSARYLRKGTFSCNRLLPLRSIDTKPGKPTATTCP